MAEAEHLSLDFGIDTLCGRFYDNVATPLAFAGRFEPGFLRLLTVLRPGFRLSGSTPIPEFERCTHHLLSRPLDHPFEKSVTSVMP